MSKREIKTLRQALTYGLIDGFVDGYVYGILFSSSLLMPIAFWHKHYLFGFGCMLLIFVSLACVWRRAE